MSTKIKYFAAALAAFAVGSASAQTAGNFAINGSFTASCSFSGSSFDLGEVQLPSLVANAGSGSAHVRVPVQVGVTCNDSSIPWRVVGANEKPYSTLTIGSNNGNRMCLSTTTTPAFAYKCSTNSSGHLLAGTGTQTVSALLLISHVDTLSNGRAYGGTGAISGSLPVTLEF